MRNNFENAQTVAEFDAAYEAAMEEFAYSFDTNDEYEAAGGDGAAIDHTDAFLSNVGLSERRYELEVKEHSTQAEGI